MSNSNVKIVVLCQKSLYSEIVIKKLLKIKGVELKGVIFSKALLSNQSFLKSILKVIRISGTRFFWAKIFSMIAFDRTMKLPKTVKVIKTPNVNDDKMVKAIKSLEPDFILSIFFNQVIKIPLLKIPKEMSLNLHPSYLPTYGGIGPTFWVLANNEKESGVTWHKIVRKIDSGNIIMRQKIIIDEFETVHSLYYRSALIGAEMIQEIFQNFMKHKKLIEEPQLERNTSYFGLPTKESMKRLSKTKHKLFSINEFTKGIHERIFGLW